MRLGGEERARRLQQYFQRRRGAWGAQLKISQLVSSSPASRAALAAQSLEPASDSGAASLPLPHSYSVCVCVCVCVCA